MRPIQHSLNSLGSHISTRNAWELCKWQACTTPSAPCAAVLPQKVQHMQPRCTGDGANVYHTSISSILNNNASVKKIEANPFYSANSILATVSCTASYHCSSAVVLSTHQRQVCLQTLVFHASLCQITCPLQESFLFFCHRLSRLLRRSSSIS